MIRTEKIVYQDERSDKFEGIISWDDSINEKRPGILIAHTIRGQTEFEEEKSIELAKLGYVGFAIDLYGQDKKTTDPDKNRELMNGLNADRSLLLKRLKLSLKTLKEHPEVDSEKTGAIGFCFGGKSVLDLARSGEEIKGVVSFHGIYDQPDYHNIGDIKASVLVLHGWDDPLANPEQLRELAKELTERKADWQIHAFGHTGHAFTYPPASSKETGFFYQSDSDRRGWKLMTEFFRDIFK